MTPWEIQGRELINCNCSYGCACQFNALPTQGYCEAIGAITIERGHYGTVSLDGLSVAMALKWPGPIHEGKGNCQLVVDAKATPEQRDALLKILSGQDTDPGATIFAVFASTYEKVFDPIFASIQFQVDVEARRGRISVGQTLEIQGDPIRNPITGDEHRARIDLPNGFEYEIAEIGSGTSRSRGNVVVDLKESYAQFAHIHMNNHGLIRHRSAA
jgi:hypothetical protein